jgi:hypothetical protein
MFSRYSVIERLCDKNLSSTTAPVAYFYCSRNPAEPERAKPEEILRSISKQLSSSELDLPIREPVVDMYKTKKAEADKDGSPLMKLTLRECVKLILALLEINPATIIIDALDECDPALRQRHNLLVALDEIVQKSANIVKVFVSSRDDNDIAIRLGKSTNVIIRASDNSEDIERFIKTEVEQSIESGLLLSGEVPPELKSQIITTLIDGAQGM